MQSAECSLCVHARVVFYYPSSSYSSSMIHEAPSIAPSVVHCQLPIVHCPDAARAAQGSKGRCRSPCGQPTGVGCGRMAWRMWVEVHGESGTPRVAPPPRAGAYLPTGNATQGQRRSSRMHLHWDALDASTILPL